MLPSSAEWPLREEWRPRTACASGRLLGCKCWARPGISPWAPGSGCFSVACSTGPGTGAEKQIVAANVRREAAAAGQPRSNAEQPRLLAGRRIGLRPKSLSVRLRLAVRRGSGLACSRHDFLTLRWTASLPARSRPRMQARAPAPPRIPLCTCGGRMHRARRHKRAREHVRPQRMMARLLAHSCFRLLGCLAGCRAGPPARAVGDRPATRSSNRPATRCPRNFNRSVAWAVLGFVIFGGRAGGHARRKSHGGAGCATEPLQAVAERRRNEQSDEAVGSKADCATKKVRRGGPACRPEVDAPNQADKCNMELSTYPPMTPSDVPVSLVPVPVTRQYRVDAVVWLPACLASAHRMLDGPFARSRAASSNASQLGCFMIRPASLCPRATGSCAGHEKWRTAGRGWQASPNCHETQPGWPSRSRTAHLKWPSLRPTMGTSSTQANEEHRCQSPTAGPAGR